MKVITTAICSVSMLNQRISIKQWAAIFLLTVGVVLVQFAQDSEKPKSKKEADLNPTVCYVCIHISVYIYCLLISLIVALSNQITIFFSILYATG